MAIISLPEDVPAQESVVCAICGRVISLAEATVGLQGLDNQQMFACNSHFKNSAQYILGWIDFILAQRAAMAAAGDARPVKHASSNAHEHHYARTLH